MRQPETTERSWRRTVARTALTLYMGTFFVLVALATTASGVRAAGGQVEIASAGPLTRIITSGDLNCQVAHAADVSFEFFGGELGACGTFVSIDGTLFGPESVPSGSFTLTPWTPVSQQPATGSGSRGDPFRIVTTVEAPGTGVRVEQTDSYVIGDESYRTDVRLSAPAERRVIVFRAGDCYLQDSDVGFGRVDGDSPACVIDPTRQSRIQQWEPITPDSRHAVGQYSNIWNMVDQQSSFPNTCECDQAVDNGAGLSWEVTIPGGGEVTVSHLTYFSPQGRRTSTSFVASVPGPAEINLDPLVLASSAALAAGVVLVVPFPAALFNSTLEENYAEVTSWTGRVSRRVGGFFVRLATAIRRRVSRPAAGAAVAPENAAGIEPAATDDGAPSFWQTRAGFVAFIALSAFVYCLLDPTFGFSLDAVTTFLGLLLGLVLTLLTYAIPFWILGRRAGVSTTLSVLPGTIFIAIACVVISRLANFQPGYLYGLIIGFGFSRELAKLEMGRIEAIVTVVGLAASVVAWIALPGIRATPGGSPILEAALVTVVVAGLEGALFGMLPMKFLPGERVRAWNARFWMVLIGVAAFAFFHILINPQSGYLAETTRQSMWTVVALLVGFGVLSVGFWAYFRFRGPRGGQPEAMPPDDPPTDTLASEPGV